MWIARRRGAEHAMLMVFVWLLATVFASSAKALTTVASINLCTDQLVLLLADDDQILSLSNLSHDQAGSYLYERARQYPATKGESEQILALQPDLIVAGEYTTRHSVALLVELGFRVEQVPIANTLEQLYSNIRNVAAWLGHPQKAQQLIDQLQERILALPQNTTETMVASPSAAFYDPNGYTVGRKTLRGEALALAGWSNAAANWGIEHYGSLPLEAMIALAPDAIIDSPYGEGTYSRGQQVLKHPALRAGGLDPMVIKVPSRQTICAGPWTVDLIELLALRRQQWQQSQ